MTIDWNFLARINKYKDPKEMLINMYYNMGKSLYDIEKELLVSRESIARQMRFFNLPRRRRGPKRKKYLPCPSCDSKNIGMLEDHIYKKYITRYYKCRDCSTKFKTHERITKCIR